MRQRKRKWLRRLIVGLAAFIFLLGLAAYVANNLIYIVPDPYAPKQPDLRLGEAAVRAGPGELKSTTVTPHLDAAIEAGRNTLYCATAQLAWNELCSLAGGPLSLEGAPPAAAALNHQELRRADLDEASLVAAAGTDGPALARKFRKEIVGKFGAELRPGLLEAVEAAPPGELVAYSMLAKGLPFEWAFDKSGTGQFLGSEVRHWGISQYLSSDKPERLAAGQLHLYDYRGRDDFILEIDTRSTEDQLILAKVPPAPTLGGLVRTVSARMAASRPDTGMDELADMRVPVIDFDVVHDYAELCGRRIGAANPQVNGRRLAVCRQGVRFRLDERGATLVSATVFATGIAEVRHLIFDKPFLIMIRRRGAELPYFALWLGNAELMDNGGGPAGRG